MSTGKSISHFSSRFREERDRLGFSRPDLATAVGVTFETVKNWEGGASFPNANVLAIFHEMGADIFYIITGRRMPSNMAMEEVPPDRLTPAKRAAAQITGLRLSDVDAELLITMSKRLAQTG